MKTDNICKIYKLHSEVNLPFYGTENSACFDLAYQNPIKAFIAGYNVKNKPIERVVNYSSIKFEIHPGDRLLVPTGLIFDLPENYSLRLHPRSGLSLKKGVILANCQGVIDSDYVEPLFIMITNIGENPVIIEHNERLCQGELIENNRVVFEWTKQKPKIKTSRRGGFGSTDNQTPEFLEKELEILQQDSKKITKK